MLFERLLVENLGVFRGEHSIDLLPTDPQRPIVLVGALNGSGKTTVIEALQLALYGKRAGYGWRGAGSYSAYLAQVRNRHANLLESTVAEVTLRLADGRRARVRRQWSFSKGQPREYIAVFLNEAQTPDVGLSETWDDEVERLLPARLSELFFFDGERIEKLADPAQSAVVLRAAVASLLGLDLVDHLAADLDILRVRQKQKLLSDADRGKLESLNAQHDAGCQEREDLHQERAALSTKLDQGKIERDGVERMFREQGGDRFQQRERLASEAAEEAGRLGTLERQLRQIAAGALPLQLVSPLLVRLREQAVARASGGDPRTHAVLRAHLDDFREWVARRSYSAKVKKELTDYAVRACEVVADKPSDPSQPDWERISQRLHALLGGGLEEASAAASTLAAEVVASTERLHVLEERLAKIPEQEQLAEVLRAQGAAEAKVSALAAEVAQVDQQLQNVERKLHGLSRQRSELLARATESQEASRISDYCQRAVKTLAQFRTDLVQRRREQLERLILEAFRLLTRKSDLVGQVKLDSETMAVSLVSTDGHALVPQQLSAGERQLLAVAMLWGLARASGRPVPVVIDTPLGRLDGEHRRAMVERYFPGASHQVILLSTDQEVDADFSQLLDDSVAHRYLIDYNEAKRSSSFSTGYFAG